MGLGKTYKYLGTEDSEVIQHQQMKEKNLEGIQQEIKNDTGILVECQE